MNTINNCLTGCERGQTEPGGSNTRDKVITRVPLVTGGVRASGRRPPDLNRIDVKKLHLSFGSVDLILHHE